MGPGHIVSVAVSGYYGKPRPALVIKDDAFSGLLSVAVLLLTSDIRDFPLFRITVEPAPDNGLRVVSQVMIDKPIAVPKSKIGRSIGRLDRETMVTVDAALTRFLRLG